MTFIEQHLLAVVGCPKALLETIPNFCESPERVELRRHLQNLGYSSLAAEVVELPIAVVTPEVQTEVA